MRAKAILLIEDDRPHKPVISDFTRKAIFAAKRSALCQGRKNVRQRRSLLAI